MSEYTDLKKKMKYINEMMGCSCFPDLLSLKIFPDGKEITESSAIYRFFRDYQNVFEFNDPEIRFFAIGDGCTPRTASMFAFRSSWECYSIDPEMKWENKGRVDRLFCLKNKVEDLAHHDYDKVVIAHVHSHADLNVSCDRIRAKQRIVIAMPCCVSQHREKDPDLVYRDESVWSPHNEIKIWYDF